MRGTINVDLDGVVYPFWQALRYHLSATRPINELKAPTTFDFWGEWGMSEGEWKSEFRRGVTDGDIYKRGHPLPGAVDSLWRLSDAGWNIRIVTKRLNHFRAHKPIITDTIEWLEQFNIPYRSIAFLGDEPKTDYYSDVVVDDNAFNFTVGPMNLLFNQPWNQGEHYDFIQRIEGWAGVMLRIGEYFE